MEQKKKLSEKLGIFGCVPIKILEDYRITYNQLKVYIALMAYQGVKDSCYPSTYKISCRTKINERSVRRAILNLIKNKWIERTRRFGMTNIYKCLLNSDIPAQNINGRIIHCKQIDNTRENVAVRRLLRTVNVHNDGHSMSDTTGQSMSNKKTIL